MQLYIRVGSVYENKQTSGFAHLTEHMTFKATQNYPDNFISYFISDLGGVINAYTEYDTTCYYVMMPSEHLEKGISALSDLAFRALMRENDLEIEKDIVCEEIKQNANDPDTGFLDWIQSTYFTSSPLKNSVLGTAETVRNATSAQLKNFYKKYYLPQNSFFVVTGCFEPAHLRKLTKKYFADWRGEKSLSRCKKIYLPEANGFRYNDKKKSANGDYIAFVIPELEATNCLSDANLFLTRAFASGKQSRLYKRLIEKDKTALDIRLYSVGGLLPGITVIQILPYNSETVPDVIYALYDEWMKVGQDCFSPSELELLQKEMLYSWMYDFEYLEALGGSLADEELTKDYKEHYKFPERIAAVTYKELKECLDLLWQSHYLSIYYQGKELLPHLIVNNIRKLFSSLPAPAFKVPEAKIHKDFIAQKLLSQSKKISDSSLKEVEITKLPNGLRLILRKVKNKPVFGVALSSSVSQLMERENERGVNFLTSDMLLFGTEKHNYDEIQKLCLNEGFPVKISRTLETTTLSGKCLEFNLDTLLSLLAEIWQHPIFPSKYLRQAKATVCENTRREKSNPFSNAFNRWSKLLLGAETNLNKPYSTVTKTLAITESQIRQWYNTHYGLENCALTVVGDFDFRQVKELCAKYFNIRKPSSVKQKPAPYFHSSLSRIKYAKAASDQSYVIMGSWCCPTSDLTSLTALYILAQALGGDLGSRFFYLLREKYGYAYQTGFDFASIRSLGYWYGYAICDRNDFSEVRQLMQDIIADVYQHGLTEEEIASAKNYLKGVQRMDLESLRWQATSLSGMSVSGYNCDYFFNWEDWVEKVTLEDIKQLTQKWFNPDNLYLYLER